MLGKYVVASHKVAAAGKIIAANVHTYGAATVVTTGAAVCATIGGIAWTSDRLEDLQECYKAWEQGDSLLFKKKSSSFLSKMISIPASQLLDSAGQILVLNHYDLTPVLKFTKDVFDISIEIEVEKKRPPLT